MKVLYFCMSAAESVSGFPINPTKAGLKRVKSSRSPRQWNGGVPVSPRSDWVVIGPFMG